MTTASSVFFISLSSGSNSLGLSASPFSSTFGSSSVVSTFSPVFSSKSFFPSSSLEVSASANCIPSDVFNASTSKHGLIVDSN